jgi:hypothetical protein
MQDGGESSYGNSGDPWQHTGSSGGLNRSTLILTLTLTLTVTLTTQIPNTSPNTKPDPDPGPGPNSNYKPYPNPGPNLNLTLLVVRGMIILEAVVVGIIILEVVAAGIGRPKPNSNPGPDLNPKLYPYPQRSSLKHHQPYPAANRNPFPTLTQVVVAISSARIITDLVST